MNEFENTENTETGGENEESHFEGSYISTRTRLIWNMPISLPPPYYMVSAKFLGNGSLPGERGKGRISTLFTILRY